ncbi:hypothetical protein LIER_13324 [Lithospermum erythrorhizon]|uniref:Uncharacterized protein n=1 Tax=Lithospermum erythrorhizon TaxID=34254 RepID=A0AAV3PX07_LITER
MSEILDLTEDPPSSTLPGQEVSKEISGLNPSTSDSLHEEGVDSAPRAKMGYSSNFLELPYTIPGGVQITEESTLWKKQDIFRATRPLLLDRIRKDYDAIRDPLEIHGRWLALNANHALACRADLLDDASADAREKERALQLQVTELKKENERLKVGANLAVKEKKEATAQTLAEIKKHDLLQARFTRLEGEHFDISNKLQRLELVHSQTAKKISELEQRAKKISELEQRAKDGEEALPQRIEKTIYD